MAKIIYNGSDPFAGISTVPLVSRSSSQNYQNRLNNLVTTIVLQGRIKIDNLCQKIEDNEYPNRLSAFFAARDSIINSFSQNFKELQVLDRNDNVIFSGRFCLIRTIDFDESSYFNLIPYTINIDVYTGEFAELGVLEPSEEWSFEDNNNCSGTLIHRVTCASFNTDTQAIENAKNFIESRSGTSGVIHPYFNLYDNPILKSKRVSINRLTGELSLEEVYLYDASGSGFITAESGVPIVGEDEEYIVTEDYAEKKGFLNYITDIKESGKNVEVAISGKITGGINSDFQDLRAIFYNKNWFSVANEYYDHGSGLSEQPVEFSTKEDSAKKEITFSLLYSNNKYSGPYLIDSTTIIRNLLDNSYCVRFKGTIKSDTGCKGERFEAIKNYYSSLNIEDLANAKFAEFGDSSITLNTKAKSKSYSESIFEPSISFEVVYCNVKGEKCGCLDSLDYKLNFRPAIPTYVASPTVDGYGNYYIQNLNFDRRAALSISGNAVVSHCCTFEMAKQDLSSKLNELNARYFVATEKILESLSFTENDVSNTIGFEVSWSGIQSCPLPSNLKVCSS